MKDAGKGLWFERTFLDVKLLTIETTTFLHMKREHKGRFCNVTTKHSLHFRIWENGILRHIKQQMWSEKCDTFRYETRKRTFHVELKMWHILNYATGTYRLLQGFRLYVCILGHSSVHNFPRLVSPTGSPSRGGDVTIYIRFKPTELAHPFLFCSRVYFCLHCPFNCILFHKFSQQLSVFSLLSLWSYLCLTGSVNHISIWKSPSALI